MSTVYILGAGASAGFDRSYTGLHCPSAKNFFTVADHLLRSDPGCEPDHYGSLALFLRKYYRLSPTDLEPAGLDMQDVLTFLDLEIEYSDSSGEIDLLREARNQFMDLLSITFGKVLDGPPCPYHGALASSLDRGDTVISFNYDLLMDSALYLNCPCWNPGTGYGINALAAGDDNSRPSPGSGVLLLKPHGSFNWVACKDCGRLYVLPFDQAGAALRQPSFTALIPEPPGHRLERLIIPPSLKKDVHGKAMQQIWEKAGKALESADRMVIIGYSLPAADFLVKRLLYRSLPFNRNLREFELVDRNNSPRGNPLTEKYLPLLRRAASPVKVSCKMRNIGEYSDFLARSAKKAVK